MTRTRSPNGDAALPGAAGERRGEVDRVCPAVTGQPYSALQVGCVFEYRVTGGRPSAALMSSQSMS